MIPSAEAYTTTSLMGLIALEDKGLDTTREYIKRIGCFKIRESTNLFRQLHSQLLSGTEIKHGSDTD